MPTGNFGNILSAFYAKKMGLPVGRLICASNENNVLTDFLLRGVYDIRGHENVRQTPSPSMDIVVASNVERLLFELTRDPELVSYWMHQLNDRRVFTVDSETRAKLQEIFWADWVENDETLRNIYEVYHETDYLMDPHTSVGQRVANNYQEQEGSHSKIVICSTAHWSKFARDVRRAFYGEQDESKMSRISPDDTEFSLLQQIVNYVGGTNISIPRCISELRLKEVRHKHESDATKQAVEEAVLQQLEKSLAFVS